MSFPIVQPDILPHFGDFLDLETYGNLWANHQAMRELFQEHRLFRGFSTFYGQKLHDRTEDRDLILAIMSVHHEKEGRDSHFSIHEQGKRNLRFIFVKAVECKDEVVVNLCLEEIKNVIDEGWEGVLSVEDKLWSTERILRDGFIKGVEQGWEFMVKETMRLLQKFWHATSGPAGCPIQGIVAPVLKRMADLGAQHQRVQLIGSLSSTFDTVVRCSLQAFPVAQLLRPVLQALNTQYFVSSSRRLSLLSYSQYREPLSPQPAAALGTDFLD
ncbi:hypothetical protein HDV00_006971 [Rhizophlyctis rosea]|nr:hypothetical protein HDV00_006971 [Rhizophlyctis rosea]